MSGDERLSTNPQVIPLRGSVGSARRPLAISRSDAETSLAYMEQGDGYELARQSTTESELLEAYGVCGRCAGSARISSTTRPELWLTCPRCGGTGRKAGTR